MTRRWAARTLIVLLAVATVHSQWTVRRYSAYFDALTVGQAGAPEPVMLINGYSEFVNDPEACHPGTPVGIIRYTCDDLASTLNLAVRNKHGQPGSRYHGTYISFHGTDENGEQVFMGAMGTRWRESPEQGRHSPEQIFWILTENGGHMTFSADREGLKVYPPDLKPPQPGNWEVPQPVIVLGSDGIIRAKGLEIE